MANRSQGRDLIEQFERSLSQVTCVIMAIEGDEDALYALALMGLDPAAWVELGQAIRAVGQVFMLKDGEQQH